MLSPDVLEFNLNEKNTSANEKTEKILYDYAAVEY